MLLTTTSSSPSCLCLGPFQPSEASPAALPGSQTSGCAGNLELGVQKEVPGFIQADPAQAGREVGETPEGEGTIPQEGGTGRGWDVETPEGEGNIPPMKVGQEGGGRCNPQALLGWAGCGQGCFCGWCPKAGAEPHSCARSPALSGLCHPSLSPITTPIPTLPPGAGSCLETDDVLGSNSKVY